MKVSSIILIASIVPALSAQRTESPQSAGELQQLERYHLGRTLGECLIARCAIFTGYLLYSSPQSGDLVPIQVQERLFDSGAAVPDTVNLRYGVPEDLVKAPRELAHAWSRVIFRPNVPVSVVMAHVGGDADTDVPVLITSSQQDTEVIRSLAAAALQLQSSQDAIRDLVNSLANVDNPALAGLLSLHLERIDTIERPDTAATLLAQLLANRNVPSPANEDMVDSIVLDYDRLNDGSRMSVVNRIAELAQSTDIHLAKPGFRGLSKIAEFDTSIRTLVSPDALSRISRNYHAFVEAGALQRNRLLESGLR